jgi:hypothetical protein
MRIRTNRTGGAVRRSARNRDDDRPHRVKIAGRLNIEELSQALQMALARMEDQGHTRVAYVSLYYRPVDHAHPEDSRTMEIALPSGPPARS